jgi:hypothetical protein
LAFLDGESVDDFALRINGLIASVRELGEEMEVVVEIEMLANINTMTIEELVGRILVVEDTDVEDQAEASAGYAGQWPEEGKDATC